jgi:hypothetical protein
MTMNKSLKKFITVTLIIIGGLTGVVMGTFGLFYVLFPDMCGNEVLLKKDSPNNEKTAYVFTRDCGATTSVSYQLSILDQHNELKNKSGNTFISDQSFEVKWKSNNELVVIYKNNAETYEMDKKVGGVTIEYKAK